MNFKSAVQFFRVAKTGASLTKIARAVGPRINLKALMFSGFLGFNLYYNKLFYSIPHKCTSNSQFSFAPAASSTVVIYKFNSDNPIAGGVILDESGLCITIGNIFPKESDERVDLEQFQARILNEEKNYRMKLVEYFPEENLTLFRLVKHDPDIHFKACKLSSNVDIGSRVVAIGKSNENYNLIEEGTVNEASLNAKVIFGKDNDTGTFNIMVNIKNVFTTLYGGPLFDQQGSVVGVIIPFDYKHLSHHILAIPAKFISGILEQYKKTGKVQRPFLGVTVKTAAGGNGAFIIKTNSDGPAAKAGLKIGDTITEINGQKITSNLDFTKCVGYKIEPLKLTVERNGKTRVVLVEPQ